MPSSCVGHFAGVLFKQSVDNLSPFGSQLIGFLGRVPLVLIIFVRAFISSGLIIINH